GQTSLEFNANKQEGGVETIRRIEGRKALKVLRASADELEAHQKRLELVNDCIWHQ
ncbi:DNA polymerase III subunit epsilon, partial [Vibrio sp. Vb2880]|nr:DNA polymerase III subunit epsilon [Vibrio sp. Vb2880]